MVAVADGRLLAIDESTTSLSGWRRRGRFRIDQVPRERAVEVEAREIEPDHLAELGQRIFRLISSLNSSCRRSASACVLAMNGRRG